jgi:hypothetical protein
MKRENIGKKLDPYGAIRPVAKDDKHVRIPSAFLDWLAGAHIGEDNSPNLKNDVLVSFVLLRNQGPTWRWAAHRAAQELKSRGFKLGRNRLEGALKFLKDHGWTRAVVVKGAGEEAVTEFLEVQWRQLPLRERRTKRIIRVDLTDGIQVFEDDGREVPKSNFDPKRIISQKAQDEQDLWHSSRRKKKSKTLSDDSPLPPNPVYRPPVYRGTGQEYYGPLSIIVPKSPSVEGPVVASPFEKETSPGPGGPGLREAAVGSVSREDCQESAAELGNDPAPIVPVVDWERLGSLARSSRECESSRREYETCLLREVFPRLEDPPIQDRWSRAESLDWCRASVKGQLFLQLVEDQDWTPDLARTFTRSPGKWSLADCRSLLRMPVLGRSDRTDMRRVSLNDLLRGKLDSDKKRPWERIVDSAKVADAHRRNELIEKLRNFSPDGLNHEKALREAAKMRDFALQDDGLNLRISDDLEVRNLLLALLSRYFKRLCGSQDEAVMVQLDLRWESWTGQMNALAASDHVALLLMRSFQARAGEIWGINWEWLEPLHAEYAKSLNFKAEVYELKKRVQPDPFWFSQEIVLP